MRSWKWNAFDDKNQNKSCVHLICTLAHSRNGPAVDAFRFDIVTAGAIGAVDGAGAAIATIAECLLLFLRRVDTIVHNNNSFAVSKSES